MEDRRAQGKRQRGARAGERGSHCHVVVVVVSVHRWKRPLSPSSLACQHWSPVVAQQQHQHQRHAAMAAAALSDFTAIVEHYRRSSLPPMRPLVGRGPGAAPESQAQDTRTAAAPPLGSLIASQPDLNCCPRAPQCWLARSSRMQQPYHSSPALLQLTGAHSALHTRPIGARRALPRDRSIDRQRARDRLQPYIRMAPPTTIECRPPRTAPCTWRLPPRSARLGRSSPSPSSPPSCGLLLPEPRWPTGARSRSGIEKRGSAD